jgi:hypothetical protein
MTNQSNILATFEAFLDEVHPIGEAGATEARATETEERKIRLAAFPYSVILQLSYPQMDFATRWCWQQFGPASGECQQYSSEYPACHEKPPHAHVGRWATHWLAKTNYDFGFNEWLFVEQADSDKFLEFVPEITWGENYEGGAQ